jgi:hypothetical protein
MEGAEVFERYDNLMLLFGESLLFHIALGKTFQKVLSTVAR